MEELLFTEVCMQTLILPRITLPALHKPKPFIEHIPIPKYIYIYIYVKVDFAEA